ERKTHLPCFSPCLPVSLSPCLPPTVTLSQPESSATSVFFQCLDLVANTSGFFVVFFVDGLFEAVAKLQQVRLCLLVLRQSSRRFADVVSLAVNVLQEGRQLFAELLVIVG